MYWKRQLTTWAGRVAGFGIAGLLAGCDLIDYHPYDARTSGPHHLNAANMALIEQQCQGRDSVRFVLISDTQRWYDETLDAVRHINRTPGVDFVIHCGDISDFGVTKEFELQRDILEKLTVPYVVLLGNHDCLGTGNAAYESIFGQPDFSFIAGRVKFVCLNTNAIEYDYSRPVPNFDFMEQEMTARGDEFDRTVVCMHAAPYSEQFNNNVAKVFNYYVMRFPQPLFCLYGHGHHTEQHDIYGNGLIYYEVGNAQKRKYYIFTITPNGYSYEIVEV